MPSQEKPVGEEKSESDSEEWREAQEGQDPASVQVLEDLDDFPQLNLSSEDALAASRKYVAYTVKLPSEQLAALQTIWLELKRLYGTHSPDKSGMIQLAITDWLKRWDGPERKQLLQDLLEIRQDTRRRQYRK